MNARELFEFLAPLVQPAVDQLFGRRDLCIFTARLTLDVCAYFDIEALPMPVRVMVYNWQFAKHVEAGGEAFRDGKIPKDGSHSVGVGFGMPKGKQNAWNGHLIVVARDCFADFAIQQAERLQHDMVTGPAVVEEYHGEPLWKLENEHGTTIEYHRIADHSYLRSPDWRGEKRRRKLAGALIRAAKARFA